MSITCDSRKVKPGDTFVAIPGVKFDGVGFTAQAIENGATVIVAEREVNVPAGIKFKKVPSARKALAELSCEFYGHPSRKLKLIGVTGTNGKTTITYLIESILKTAGFKVGLIGTINSSLTTPESSDLQKQLAEMVENGVAHCVMEVSSHALAQERVYGCNFSIAIFTNLTHDHLDFHKTMDEYLAAKQKLFKMLPPEGIAIVNVDDPYSKTIIEVVTGEVITYGITQARHELRSTKHNEFDTRVSDILIKEKEMLVKINSFEIKTPLIGIYNVYNIAAAYQCALNLGIDQRTIVKGIEALKVVPGRGERIECRQPFSVIVDFAHTPDALEKFLNVVATFRSPQNKIILVFGCPGERDREKRPMMGEIAGRLADYSIITTDDPHGEDPQSIIDEILKGVAGRRSQVVGQIDRRKAIEEALKMAKKGDMVLIAGRGHEEFQDFAGKKVPLDDREVAKEYLHANY